MKTILIADCDKSFCSSIADYLNKHYRDISVLMAGNAAEAIYILQTTPVDLLVADINMQFEDTTELMPFVKSKYPDLPVYATTEFMNMKTYNRLNALGVSNYIIKPYDMQDLFSNIVYLLGDGGPGLETTRISN